MSRDISGLAAISGFFLYTTIPSARFRLIATHNISAASLPYIKMPHSHVRMPD